MIQHVLPPDSVVHPVFHVSQLKKLVRPSVQVSPVLPNSAALYQVLEMVLDTKMIKRGDTEVQHVLVKWSNMPPELST
jgi:hypothetical protein